MLSAPKTSDPRQHGDATKQDSSAEFMQELAEAGMASDLGIVKAATDAADGERASEAKKRSRTKRPDKT